MHNLFLGTAKHVMKNVWLQNILYKEDTKRIHDTVASVVVSLHFQQTSGKTEPKFSRFFLSIMSLALDICDAGECLLLCVCYFANHSSLFRILTELMNFHITLANSSRICMEKKRLHQTCTCTYT